ncbi:TniQ family protein [Streptomyces chumphonensis]|uniref:TniQ family protein n=1 Tax=Streptomyces chumphonensis TaxID=1214925 RepID=UPI003D742389
MAESLELSCTRSLGRSLAPLPGESLAGFILRLAHRLRVSPDQVLRRTGLAELQTNAQAAAKSALSTSLSGSRARRFAHAARLSIPEATALTLEPLAGHYPPVARALSFQRAGKRIRRLSWLSPVTARYCPQCLAGDGSVIQNQHGGPWQTCWRLPVVFACLRHNVFLEHLCPGCGHPIGTAFHGQLIARPTIAGLHPAQCRQRHPAAISRPRTPDALCATRLDRSPPPSSDRPGPEFLALQTKINSMLDPHQPGERSSQYLTELLLVSALVEISWPRARPTAADATALGTADRVIADRVDSPEHRYYCAVPPRDARAGAALFLAADRTLNSTDLRSTLTPLAPTENRNRSGIIPRRHHTWDDMLKKHRAECSERFQLATQELVFNFRRDKSGNRAPTRGLGYRPEHVPAFLPKTWVERHLSQFTGLSNKTLRRGSAILLVQRAQGGNLNTAAEFLGLNPRNVHTSRGRTLGTIRSQGDPLTLDLALDALTAELQSTPLIDYQRRRQALATWTLPPDTWEVLLAKLDRKPGAAITDDRKRLAVTVYIWTHVTQGQPEHAPCPAHISEDPVRRREWTIQRRNICRLFGESDRHPHYQQLKTLLHPLIAQLADTIDRNQTPRSGPW